MADIIINLEEEPKLDVEVHDINYIPAYVEAENERKKNELERIANELQRIDNEEERQKYIDDLKQRVENGEFDGKDGQDGTNGVDGKDGYTPVKGIDYFDGADGKDGINGQDGYTPVKGVDYFDGVDGKDGIDGKDGVGVPTGGTTGQALIKSSDNDFETVWGNVSVETITYIEKNDKNNPFILADHEPGVYVFPTKQTKVWYKLSDKYDLALDAKMQGNFLFLIKTPTDTMEINTEIAMYFNPNGNFTSIQIYSNELCGISVDSVWGDYNFVNATTEQYISGVKIFNALPESKVIPTTDKQFTNKKYVDDAVANAGGGIAEETDPTVPSFVKNITEEDIAKWNESGGGVYYVETSQSKPFNIGTAEIGTYIFNSSEPYYITFDGQSTLNFPSYLHERTLYIYRKYSDCPSYENFAFCIGGGTNTASSKAQFVLLGKDSAGRITVKKSSNPPYVQLNGAETIGGEKTFSVAPKTNAQPTQGEHLTNKNYVDNTVVNKQNKVLSGTDEPTADLGVDGDVYLQITEYPIVTTDSNGWTVINFETHKEYVMQDTRTVTMDGSSWKAPLFVIPLPFGIETMGDRILTGSIYFEDGAINGNIGANRDYDSIHISARNNYSGTVTSKVHSMFRILELPVVN